MAPRLTRGSPGTDGGELAADEAHLDVTAFSQWSGLATSRAQAESFPICASYRSLSPGPWTMNLTLAVGFLSSTSHSVLAELCLPWTRMSKASAPVPNNVTIFRDEAFKEAIKAE